MQYRGKVVNGVIVLEEQSPLPEGSEVVVTLRERPPEPQEPIPTLAERLRNVIGIIDDPSIPSDASMNIDHYLYGAPKR